MSGQDSEKARNSSGRRQKMLAIAAIFLALGGGGAAYYVKSRHAAPKNVAVAQGPVNFPIPTIMATLDPDGGHATFVRVAAQIQLASGADVDATRSRLPQIEDLFQTYLHDTRPDELNGSGIYRLREALFAQISNVLAPVPVRDLFFTELLVQ